MNDYIIRKKLKQGFRYEDKHGNRISVSQAKPYLTMYIPPAYHNVKINRKSGKVRAIGYDDKQRPQYIYDPRYTQRQGRLKFSKLIRFGEQYDQIQKKIQRDLHSKRDTKEKQIATILKLIEECDFRVGNDKYTQQNNSYGVTTLEVRHVKQTRGKLVIDFIGKKGVRNQCRVHNRQVSRNLQTKRKKKSPHQRLFSYRDGDRTGTITSKDVNDYLKQWGTLSTKYFRTWSANIAFIGELLKGQSLKQAIEATAHKLHNTPAVCKRNYLDPKLLDLATRNLARFKSLFKGDIHRNYTEFLKRNYSYKS